MILGSVQQEQSMINSLLAEDEPPWRTTLTVAHTPVSFKIDSVADALVMSETTYETLRPRLHIAGYLQKQIFLPLRFQK